MDKNKMSQEEIDKLLKSLNTINKFIGIEETNPKELLRIDENLLEITNETEELIKKHNSRWVDIYAETNNSFCKMMIKNLTDKNFMLIDELEQQKIEISKNIEEIKEKLNGKERRN